MLRFLTTLVFPSVSRSTRPGSPVASRRVASIIGLSLLMLAMLVAVPAPVLAQATDEAPAAAAAPEAPAVVAAPEAAPAEGASADEPSPAKVEAKAEPASPPAEEKAAEPEGEPSTEEPAAESAEGSAPLVKQIGTTTVTPVSEGSEGSGPGSDDSDATSEGNTSIHWVALLLTILVIGGACGLAAAVASSLRMREYQTKLTIIFLSLFAAAATTYSGWPPKLGIDLKGGVYLVYEADRAAQQSSAEAASEQDDSQASVSGNLTSEQMGKLVTAIGRRINPGGVKEVIIRPFGQNQIEIVIPDVDDSEIERYKDKITSAGTLEFRIVANRRDPRHTAVIEAADARPEDKVLYMRDVDGNPVRDETGALKILGWWVPVSVDADVTHIASNDTPQRPLKMGDRTLTEVLVVNDMYNVTGAYLSSSRPSVDEKGRACVSFNFDTKGGQLFGGLTGENTPDESHDLSRKLGIILDGYLFSAPAIITRITSHGQITGDFSEKDVTDLVDVLNAGSLPTTLKPDPISQMATGPTLGKDTIISGGVAIAVSLLLVLLFMLAYYRFAGVVANLALLANLLLILGVMIFVKAAFTLPGIAGLVLTVGMAVDANVLIYERIREELDRQATLRMAIRNGFARATTTIVDANLTTLITGIVLYTVGTDQIKGFAVTLILGVLLSMYTAIYCARVIFDIAEKKRWITKLSMARIPLGGTVDFVGLRRVALGASAAVIVVGLIAVVIRGKGLLDIDFTGGVAVQVEFKEPKKTQDIRDALNARPDVFEDLAVHEMTVSDKVPHTLFAINTGRHDEEMDADAFLEEVKTTLEDVFGQELVHHSMSITSKSLASEVKPAEAKPAEPKPTEPKPTEPQPTDSGAIRTDLPGDDLLALAEDGDEVPAAAPAAEGSEPVAGAETPAAEEAAKSSDAAAEVATPGESSKAATPAVAPSVWTVRFGKPDEKDQDVAYATLMKSIDDKMAALGLTGHVELTNADYLKDYDQDTGHKEWEVLMTLPPDQGTKVLEEVKASFESVPVFPSSNTIGGQVASDTQWKAGAALLASLVFIVAYIWIRFQRVMFGLAAVVALIHDVLVTLGVIALTYWLAPVLGFLLIEQFKIGLPVLAAFLTIIGYSLNDTIVVFDRIREVRGKSPNLTGEMINKSINQTLSRTLLTSFTTLIVVVILYVFGGDAIRVFAFSLVIGVMVGTYSSIFVASPVLLWIAQSSEAKSRAR